MSEENTPSVYSKKLKAAIEAIPQELHSLSEETLRIKLNPTIKLYELKRAFWEELCQAQDEGRSMRVWRVYDGKVSKNYFYADIITDPLKMAWITSPLNSYEEKTKAALDMVTERYNELITMEITTTKRIKDNDGDYVLIKETDPKKALVLLQVIKNLEDRIKGTAVQRQVSVHAGEPSGQGVKSATLNMDAVEERLAELENKLGERGISYDGGEDRHAELQQDNAGDNKIESRGAEREDIIDTSFTVVKEGSDSASESP